MQDFTGVPAVVDLAAMREAMKSLGGDPARINPLQPAELVIDHSVQVDKFGSAAALAFNSEIEYLRNRERYQFLKWGQKAFDNFKVVPPETGIVHQVNLEYLGRVVFSKEANGSRQAFPDTLVGTDSHTTMINGLGVLGWGVGGIEAEAAMLGQPISMLIPQVVGFKLTGKLAEGATATDLVLTVTQMLRDKGVVGKFVEFFGDGLDELPLADRATIANMAPEYGATCGIFPIDDETLAYLRLTGRSDSQVALVEAYAKEQGLFREPGAYQADYTDTLELDMGDIEPSLAGPKRPQDRISLKSAKSSYASALSTLLEQRGSGGTAVATAAPQIRIKGAEYELPHGSVVIAAITSCTNTSNPAVMIGAGLVAKKARRTRPASQALGQNQPRSRFEGRYRIPEEVRTGPASRFDRLQPCRLRLHDLHRQLGSSVRGDIQRHQRGRSGRRVGSLGQPQLRGARAPRSTHELPRLASARRRLRPRGIDGHRHRQRRHR